MDRCRGGGGVSAQMKRKKITRAMKSRGTLNRNVPAQVGRGARESCVRVVRKTGDKESVLMSA